MSFLEHSFDCWATEKDEINFNTLLKGVEHISMSNGEDNNNDTSSFCENQILSEFCAKQSQQHDKIKCTAIFSDVDALNASFNSGDSFELISLPHDTDNMQNSPSLGTQNIV